MIFPLRLPSPYFDIFCQYCKFILTSARCWHNKSAYQPLTKLISSKDTSSLAFPLRAPQCAPRSKCPWGTHWGCAQLKVPPQGADEVFHPQAVPPILGGVSRHLPKPPSGRLWRDLIIAHASNTPAPTSTPHQRQRRKRYKQSPEPTTTPTVPIPRNQHRQICTYPPRARKS